MNYGTNPDHARNTLSNCGVKQPRYGDRRNRLSHTKKKGRKQRHDWGRGDVTFYQGEGGGRNILSRGGGGGRKVKVQNS